MTGKRKQRVPENFIKSGVSALPIKAFNLFYAIITKAF
jgi:hypothetical protein